MFKVLGEKLLVHDTLQFKILGVYRVIFYNLSFF